jgi:hypothetical protein
MSITVNSDIEISLAERGYEIIQEQKEGSTWRAVKRVDYAESNYKVVVTNNIVVRNGCFMEEYILSFTIENFLREVEVRCTYLKAEHLLAVVDNILYHISKYVAAISDIPEDVAYKGVALGLLLYMLSFFLSVLTSLV